MGLTWSERPDGRLECNEVPGWLLGTEPVAWILEGPRPEQVFVLRGPDRKGAEEAAYWLVNRRVEGI